MVDFLIAQPNVPFAIALTLLIAIFLIELGGFLFGTNLTGLLGYTPDIDLAGTGAALPDASPGLEVDAGATAKFLYWLKIGRVPIMILIVIFMASFVICGYGLQSLCLWFLGFLLPSYLAAILSVLLTLPFVRLTGSGIARIIPKDETAAISLEELVGLRAVITIGTAKRGSPAQARTTDRFGTTHYVMVEPDRPGDELASGRRLLLVRYDKRLFYAINHPEINLK
ncbi:MAG: YqiJ family protein [Deltaproteobacteria bacterium]|nr:YqiJ family protein [Deltaproteobacteria bacterium]